MISLGPDDQFGEHFCECNSRTISIDLGDWSSRGALHYYNRSKGNLGICLVILSNILLRITTRYDAIWRITSGM